MRHPPGAPDPAARTGHPDPAPEDPVERLGAAVEALTAPDELPFRTGKAALWLEEALAPLRARMPAGELHRLVLSIRTAIGIEALVWLTDLGGLSRDEAVETMRWSAKALLRAALAEHPALDGVAP